MPTQGGVELSRPKDDALHVKLSGEWKLGCEHPEASELVDQVRSGVSRVTFDASDVAKWDTTLVRYLAKVVTETEDSKVELDRDGLPEGVRKLLDLAFAVPEKKTGKKKAAPSFVAKVGLSIFGGIEGFKAGMTFIGEATLSLLRFVVGKARFRRVDLMLTIQQCGAEALGIVSLISFLIGVILALIGAAQLQMFDSEIFVADLVGLAMTREMGCIMTGIIMAGRTGAAFAAQLGTMTVNEEVDALKTMGFSPMDFLVLPRMLALMLMMPLLCLYSDLLGILGGFVIGVGMLDISPTAYQVQTFAAITVPDFAIGVVKSAVFGVIVALSGCMKGMQSGRSASAVGLAATSAVVTAILLIIVSDAVFTVVCNVLGI